MDIRATAGTLPRQDTADIQEIWVPVDTLGIVQQETAVTRGTVDYLATVVFRGFRATADSPERAGTADSRDLADTQVILPLIQDTLVTPVPVDIRATRQRVLGHRDSAGFLDLYQERAASLVSVGKADTRDSLLLRDILGSRQEADTAGTQDLAAKAEAGIRVIAERVGTAGILHSQDSREPLEKAGIRVTREEAGTLGSVDFAGYQVTLGFQQQVQGHLGTAVTRDLVEQDRQVILDTAELELQAILDSQAPADTRVFVV